MKKIASIATVFFFACLLLYVSGVTSCYTTRTVSPDKFNESYSDRVKEITVVKTDGSRQVFVNGWIDGDSFYGIDGSQQVTSIPLAGISHFHLKIFSRGRTLGLTLGLLGGVFAAGLIFSVVVYVTHTTISCPHVYSYDGQDWTLDAEPYSGAIARSGEFTDYSVLDSVKPLQGTYRLKFINESNEIEHTNEVKLVVVDHDPSFEIIPDASGEPVAVSDLKPPLHAVTQSGEDIAPRIDGNGELFWEGNPSRAYADPSRPREELHLKFEKPAGAGEAKLILKGSNTLWGYRVMEDFLAKFGGGARKKLEKLDSDPEGKKKIEGFLKKNGAWIEVLVLVEGRWEPAGYFREVGSSVARTQVLRIGVPKGAGAALEVRLRWAPLFWNIMRLGVDFSEDAQPAAVREIAPVEAVDTKAGDIAGSICAEDDVYYTTRDGDEATLTFAEPPPVEGMKRTVILKTRGYYSLLIPDGKEASLMEKMTIIMKKKGIDAYSLEEFRKRMGGAVMAE
jgi:hypothetical protein